MFLDDRPPGVCVVHQPHSADKGRSIQPSQGDYLPAVSLLIRLTSIVWLIIASVPAAAQSESSPAAIRQYRAAVALQNQGLYDLAGTEWQAFVNEYPDDRLLANGHHYLGVCRFQNNDFAGAAEAFEKSLQIAKQPDQDVTLRAATLLNLGLSQFNLGRTDATKLQRAIATLTELLEAFPQAEEVSLARLYLAESLLAATQAEGAAAQYALAARQDPEHPEMAKLLSGWATALQKLKQHEAASQKLSRLIADYPSSPLRRDAEIQLAESTLARNNLISAERQFQRLAADASEPLADYAAVQFSVCLERQRQYREAAEAYADAMDRFPKSRYLTDARLGCGRCRFLDGDHESAMKVLQPIADFEPPMRWEAAHWLASALTAMGKPSATLRHLDEVEGSKPDGRWHVQLQLDRADALFELADRRSEALRTYQDIVARYPKHELAPQAAYMTSFTAIREHDVSLAASSAEAFLREYPNDPLRSDVRSILAESLLQSGDVSEAEAIWRQLVAENRGHADWEHWITRVAICANRTKQHQKVIAWLSPRIEKLTGNESRGEAEFLLGSALLQTGDRSGAERLLRASLATDRNGPQSERAELLLSDLTSDSPKAALAAIESLIQRSDNVEIKSQAALRRADLLYAARDYEAAAAAYQMVIDFRHSPDLMAASLFGLAWCKIDLGEFAAAEPLLRRLQESYPQHALATDAWYLRAMIARELGDFSSAIDCVNAYLDSNPPHAGRLDALHVRGLSHVGLKDHKGGIEDFRTILRSGTDYARADEVLYELAWAYRDSEKSKSAHEVFLRLVRDHPRSPVAAESYFRVGEYWYESAHFEKAAVAYERAIELSRGQNGIRRSAMHKLGWAFYQQRQFSKAKGAFENQLRQFASGDLYLPAQMMIGECAFQLDDYATTIASVEELMDDAFPCDALASTCVLHAGQAAMQLGQLEKSLLLFEQCERRCPGTTQAIQAKCERANVLQRLNRDDEAFQLYQAVAAATDAPVGARATFMMGELLFAEKKYEDAIRTFFRVAYGYGHPNSPPEYHVWQADAMFEAARCCESLRRIENAKKLYQDIIHCFPQSEKADLAGKKLTSLGE